MLYVLVAHKAKRYDRDYNESTDGMFICEEHERAEEVEKRVVELLMRHGNLDYDDLFVYEIEGRDDNFYRGDYGPNTAQKFLDRAKPIVKAAKEAAEEHADRVREAAEEGKRVAALRAERTQYERLKRKFESTEG